VTDYFKQKMLEKTMKKETSGQSDSSDDKKKKKKQKFAEVDLTIEPDTETRAEKKKKKKKRKLEEEACDEPESEIVEIIASEEEIAAEPPIKKKKKSKKAKVEELEVELAVAEEPLPSEKSKKKKKSKTSEPEPVEDSVVPVEEIIEKSTKKSKKDAAGEPDRPRGANAVYSTNVITIPSHVAQKMASVNVRNFKYSNVANIIGYGLTEDIEMKVVQTKIGDNSNTDKYAIYNMDKMTRQRVDPRKIKSTIKRTKKSIQVI
jgi:hypothetical protein